MGRFYPTHCKSYSHTWPSFYSLCPDFSVLNYVPGTSPRNRRPLLSPIWMPLSEPTSDFTFSMQPSLIQSFPLNLTLPSLNCLQFWLPVSLSSELWDLDVLHEYVRYRVCLTTPQSIQASLRLQVIHSLNKCLSINYVCHISHSVLGIIKKIKNRKNRKRYSHWSQEEWSPPSRKAEK